jgi:amino acid transporter
VELGDDTKAVLLAAGLLFLWALLLGVVKYRQMLASPEGHAHPYTDTAHRAALLYSFAALLIATFVELSGWSDAVDLVAAGALIVFFAAAIATYMVRGLQGGTDNQVRDRVRGLHSFMAALIAAEIAGFLVLLAGFVEAQIL